MRRGPSVLITSAAGSRGARAGSLAGELSGAVFRQRFSSELRKSLLDPAHYPSPCATGKVSPYGVVAHAWTL